MSLFTPRSLKVLSCPDLLQVAIRHFPASDTVSDIVEKKRMLVLHQSAPAWTILLTTSATPRSNRKYKLDFLGKNDHILSNLEFALITSRTSKQNWFYDTIQVQINHRKYIYENYMKCVYREANLAFDLTLAPDIEHKLKNNCRNEFYILKSGITYHFVTSG